MQEIPILYVDEVMLVSIQTDLHDALIHQLQEDLLRALERRSARGLVLDVSAVTIMDTFTARALAQTAQMATLMGTRTIVAGMHPNIALTLTEMGFAAFGFETALNLDGAIERLNRNGMGHRVA